AGERARDGGGYGEIVVLLGPQPPERVADVYAAPPAIGRRVRAAAVNRRAQVDDGGAGAHDRIGDLVVLRMAVGRPAMTAGDDARRAVRPVEVDQRDDRCELQLGMRLGNEV